MKKIFPSLMLFLVASSLAYGQCDKPVLLTASKTEYLNPDSTVERTMEEKATISFDKKSISVVAEHDKTMKGEIHSSTCHWSIPYKKGKTVLEATFTDGADKKDVTITITGKDGKITLLWYMKSKDRLIRVVADKFEERQL